MPFIPTHDYWSTEPNGYIWRYSPTEVIDVSIIKDTPRLILMTDTGCEKYVVPSLEVFEKTLIHLEIWEMDVSNCPKIPSSVLSLELVNTTICNINQIDACWENIEKLTIDSNVHLNGSSLIVPNGIQHLIIMTQRFDIIRFPSTIISFRGVRVKYTQLTGWLPQKLHCNEVYPSFVGYICPYKQLFDRVDDMCRYEIASTGEDLEYDIQDNIINKWNEVKRRYVVEINRQINQTIYEDFGSIPGRISITKDNIDNPIVVTFHLAANYPRRMAEFITESTVLHP